MSCRILHYFEQLKCTENKKIYEVEEILQLIQCSKYYKQDQSTTSNSFPQIAYCKKI